MPIYSEVKLKSSNRLARIGSMKQHKKYVSELAKAANTNLGYFNSLHVVTFSSSLI